MTTDVACRERSRAGVFNRPNLLLEMFRLARSRTVPGENGYCESFNSKLRDEILATEKFSTLYEAPLLVEVIITQASFLTLAIPDIAIVF